MSNVPARTLERIRALLAQAEATPYPEEAETYRNAATDLITKWGVEQAMLQHHGAVKEEFTKKFVLIQGPYVEEKRYLIRSIAVGLGLYSYRHATYGPQILGKRRKVEKVEQVLCGFPSDITQVELLYTSLLLQSATELAREERSLPSWYGANERKAWKRTWLIGYADKIRELLERQRAKAAAEAPAAAGGTSAELVLLDKTKKIEAWVKSEVKLSTLPKRKLSGSGYYDGVAAGARANIGTEDNRLGRRSTGAINA